MTRHPGQPGFRRLACFVGVLCAVALIPASAYAYIDPGTGSFVIQGAIAVVLGAGVTVRLFWRRIRATLTGRPLSPRDVDDADDDQ